MSTFGKARKSLLAITATLFGLACAWPSAADTLKTIKERGKIIVGVQTDNIPWGYIDGDGVTKGYDIDIAKELASRYGVSPEFVKVTAANRIAMLNTRKVDLLIAVVGMFPDRAKAVQFSKPYSTIDIIVLASKKENITSIDDLKTKRVGVARGTSLDMTISELLNNSSNIQRYEDDPMSIQALYSGQVDAVGASSMYMITMKNLPNFDNFEQKLLIKRQYNGIAMRKDDTELQKSVNDFIDEIRTNGTLNKLNNKWVGTDLPELAASIEGVPF